LFSNPSRRSSGRRRDGWSGGKQKRRVLHPRRASRLATRTVGRSHSDFRTQALGARARLVLRCRRVGHGLERTFCLPLFFFGLAFLVVCAFWGSDQAVRATEKRKRAVAVRFGRPESLEIFAKGLFYSDENKIRDLQHVCVVRCVENAISGGKNSAGIRTPIMAQIKDEQEDGEPLGRKRGGRDVKTKRTSTLHTDP